VDDIIAIQQLLNSYTEAASRADWAVVKSCFTEDAIWETPAGKIEGREAALAKMAELVAGFDYIVQLNAPGVITVTGDTATARSVIRECGKLKGQDVAMEFLAHYNDRIVRTAEGWKFAHRVFVSQGMHSFAVSAIG
jgi:ketosteroid isomerase-like protein